MMDLDHIAECYGAPAAWMTALLRLRSGRLSVDAAASFRIRYPMSAEVLRTLTNEHDLSPVDVASMCPSDLPPAAWRLELNARHRSCAFHILALLPEIASLADLLGKAGFDIRFWKGPALSMLLHGDFTTRITRDIDILVHRAALPAIRRVLLLQGYLDVYPLPERQVNLYLQHHREWVMRKSLTGGHVIYVELQWSPVMPWFHLPGIDRLAFEGVDHLLFGGIHIPVPAADIHLLLVAMHHGLSDGWRQGRQVSDMASFMALPPGRIDWERLRGLSIRFGLLRTIALGLGVAEAMAGSRLPAAMLSDLAGEGVMLRRITDRLLLASPSLNSESALRGLARRLHLSESGRSRWHVLIGHFRKWLAPGYFELRHYDLPEGLYFAYLPIKLLRPLLKVFVSQSRAGVSEENRHRQAGEPPASA